MNKYVLTAILLFSVASTGFAQNMLTNPGFEIRNADKTDWTGMSWGGWGLAEHEVWANHSGTCGMYFVGFSSPNGGGVFQDVAETNKGTYTFSAFVLQESGFEPTVFELKLEYYDATGTNEVQGATTNSYLGATPDGRWHHYYVTGVATADAMKIIRPVVASDWGATSDGAVFVDDCELYTGTYVGVSALSNKSFEMGNFDSWRGSSWGAVPETNSDIRTWADMHSGARGVAFFGWDNDNEPREVEFSQPLTMMPTGTYTFAAFMSREEHFLLTNAQLRIDWYDATLTNLVESAVTNFNVPNDNTWREYWVSGTCTNTNAFEMRPTAFVGWQNNVTNNPGPESARFDDVRLLSGEYDGNNLIRDWGYYSGGTNTPFEELVPGTNGLGTFIQVDYAKTTTTFYIVAPNPDVALLDGETAEVGMRWSWQDPQGAWSESHDNASWVANVVITNTDQFHGSPTNDAGVVLDIWKYEFTQPLSNGVPYTNEIIVFYAPFFRSRDGDTGAETDFDYLLANGDITNNWEESPQQFGINFSGNDYNYTNLWSNPGFDTDGDGMPDWWELLHFGGVTNANGSDDSDVDTHTDEEEWVFDTDPTNPASVYANAYTNPSVLSATGEVLYIKAGPPTSANRQYDVWWKVDLTDNSDWTPIGLNVVGVDTGTPVTLIVTNDVPNRAYRTGVRVP